MNTQPIMDHLMKVGTIQKIPAGSTISSVWCGSDCLDCFVLLEGDCTLSSVSERGNEVIYYAFDKGDVMRYMPLVNHCYVPDRGFEKFPDSDLYTVVAQADSSVLRIPGSECKRLADDPRFQHLLLASLGKHLSHLTTHCSQITHSTATSKICFFLLNACEPNAQCLLQLEGKYSYPRIAKNLGIHEVTVADIMRKLIAIGVLERQGRCVLISDEARLRAFAEGNESLKY